MWIIVELSFICNLGQYDGINKPMPEYHIKVVGFDQRVSNAGKWNMKTYMNLHFINF